ncbi:alpha/beta hydrolase [Rhodobacteraceae bacterium WD3A24]|nr:alpha/beta hydrolase [Rhodobacteraceae bacterium WD3A24]
MATWARRCSWVRCCPEPVEDAPLFDDLAEGPPGGRALWLRSEDKVRLRLVHWPGGDAGTVLLLPGRTEWAEKYGPVAAFLAARGLHVLTPDWRGQGLSDRLVADARVGHVGGFRDYQADMDAICAAARRLGTPAPLFVLAHSMGGAIALRWLIDGGRAAAAAFSAPMWGIVLPRGRGPLARVLSLGARLARADGRYVPGTGPATLLLDAPFEDNPLTGDPAQFARMAAHLRARPELALGGPSLRWLGEALAETRALARLPSPPVPALTGLGGRESIVTPAAIEARMARWPGGRLDRFDDAGHELMMERAALRERFLEAAAAHFHKAGRAG